MSEKVKISINKRRILDSSSKNSKASLVAILLIIKYSLNGTTKSISLNRLAFILDAINKGKSIDKTNVLLSKPWQIPNNMRKLIIMAHEQKLIEIIKNNSDVKFLLDERGNKLLDEIEKEQLFSELTEPIKYISGQVKESDLVNQQLIW